MYFEVYKCRGGGQDTRVVGFLVTGADADGGGLEPSGALGVFSVLGAVADHWMPPSPRASAITTFTVPVAPPTAPVHAHFERAGSVLASGRRRQAEPVDDPGETDEPSPRLRIVWQRPAHDGGDVITHYVITVRRWAALFFGSAAEGLHRHVSAPLSIEVINTTGTDTSTGTGTSTGTNASATTVADGMLAAEIDELAPFTFVSATVVAWNGAGCSPPSARSPQLLRGGCWVVEPETVGDAAGGPNGGDADTGAAKYV
jgi:hypothetical protein